jgi:ribosome-associated toxin RatA of RatAB toxin-antitoxin module
MTTIHKSALVRYSAEQMYELVNDVESYPEFLPWCASARVIWQNNDRLKATIALSIGKVKQAFTTENLMEEGRRIEMNLVEGPFKYLQGTWRFQPLGAGGCEVSLHLDFEFATMLLGLAFGRAFNQVASSLVDAFCQRATQRYGNC